MRILAMIISYLSLILLVAAPVLFYVGNITLDSTKNIMLITTITWFATAIFWMDRPVAKKLADDEDKET